MIMEEPGLEALKGSTSIRLVRGTTCEEKRRTEQHSYQNLSSGVRFPLQLSEPRQMNLSEIYHKNGRPII